MAILRVAVGGGGLTRLSTVWALFVELPEETLLLFEQLRALDITCQHSLNDCGVVSSHLGQQPNPPSGVRLYAY